MEIRQVMKIISHLITLIDNFKKQNISFKSITEQIDITMSHGEFLFSVFGALGQYERALSKERIMAGLKSAKQRGKIGGRPKAISVEKMQAIAEALKLGTSKTSICRTFNVKRTTLHDNLDVILS